MDQERWRHIKQVLGDALDLPASKRIAYLDEACAGDPELRAEVDALLEASEDTVDFIETPALAQADDWLSGLIGERIGPYRIVELLGEGGMGAVYRGVRDDGDFQQQIAIKLVKRGMDTNAILRRFRAERRILARLDHPNICKLIDGGVTDDGLPYFVMEYLQGTPIQTYCQEHKLNVRERLNLFVQLCGAVEYSHRNLVVHRDLKAKNILVTRDGVPKLLDFGIAKLLDRDSSTNNPDPTVAADRLFTPDYASPEQIRGESITTAADIYSLGVLLYEMLTERRPFHLTGMPHAEMSRIITEQDPAKASSVAPREIARELVGDLDTIINKAMHKSPDRRYGSAQQFAEDLRRHMDGRPVLARGDTVAYRASKFFQRNRTLVLAASLAAIGLFVGGLAAAWQRGVAISKEQEARKRFSDIRELANSFLGELDTELERLPGSTTAREIMARRVLKYLDQLAKDEVNDIALQRELGVAYERLGDVEGGPTVSNLGNTSAALDAYGKAIAIFDKIGKTRPGDAQVVADQMRAYSKMSDVKSAMLSDHQGSLELELRMRAMREEWVKNHPADRSARRTLAANLQSIAGRLDLLGRYEESLGVRRQALGMVEDLHASGPVDSNLRLALALAYKRLGRTLHRTRRYEEAIPNFLKALAIEQQEVQRDPVSVTSRVNLSFTWNDMGFTQVARGDPAKAFECYREALKLREELVRSNPKDVRSASLLATTRLRLGALLAKTGKTEDAVRLMRESLQAREQLAAKDPDNLGARAEVAEASAALADVYLQTRRAPLARDLYERAHGIFAELRGLGKLSADFVGEPDRLAAALAKLSAKGVS
ncbi:MAG TPA: serine/threonine-protein kinase [Bryobacteraceae bacterium]|nr:serine/threonine-protein kinase [Bryobacteraceae bacterium]